tara:strand:- start:48 stop:1409 length:1362 start_codon:yes stop_codon:yes gene_type:complete
MANPWRVRRGVYELVDDSRDNRKKLRDYLTARFKKDGYKPKGILYGKDKVKQRIGTTSQKNILANPKNEKLKLEIKVSSPKSLRSSDMKQQTSISGKARAGFRNQDITLGKNAMESLSRIGSIDKNLGKIEAHHRRMLQMYRPFFEGLSTKDRAELADFAFNSKYALGNDLSNRALLSEPFHKKIHDFMRERGYQVSSKKIKAGYKYPGVPELGNTIESRKNAISHFFENVQDPIERKLNEILWEQNDAIKPPTQKELDYVADWFNDNERVAEIRANRLKPDVETTELGRPLGGIGNKIQVGGGLRRADQALLLGTNIATGNIAGAGVQAGTIAATEAMKTRVVQKAFAKQVAELTAKRGAKSALKLIPGVDIGISAKESWDYAMQGKFDQAAIAAASGAVGWVPGVGDAASAGLDIMNTGIDISRLHIRSKNKNRNKIQNVDAPRRWLKFKP